MNGVIPKGVAPLESMERLNLTWLDWPVFVAVIVLGTGTCLVLMGIGIAWDLWDHFRANRIYELNRRK